jgi:small subunit ribosomal protein S17
MGTTEKLQLGTVVSNKMDKTVVVRIDRHKRHRLYGKTIRVTRRYKAHDENNECRLGDIVKISETRPLSRDKRWRVVEVVVKGDVAEVAPTEIGSSLSGEIRAAQSQAAAKAAADERAANIAAREAAAAAAALAPAPEAVPAPEPVAEDAAASEESDS